MAAKPKVRINWKRANIVFGLMLKALEEKRFPYDQATQPHIEENLPKLMPRGGREEARFFLVVCYYMMGGVESDTAFRALSKVYDAHPEIFTTNFSEMSDEDRIYFSTDIFKILSRMKLTRRKSAIADQWTYNFAKLDRFWDGDPRKLFEDQPDHATLLERMQNGGRSRTFKLNEPNGFLGFGEKMVSMLAFYFMDRQLIPYYHFPPPIDFHAFRIMTACKLLTVVGAKDGDNLNSAAYREAARRLCYEYCVRNDASALRLCDAIWLLSRTGCRYHPGNRSVPEEYKGRQTKINPAPYTWTPTRVKRYTVTCGQCPIEHQCLKMVPSAHFYHKTQIRTRGDRTKPPIIALLEQ